jgi:hypothetical protein
MKLPVIDPAIHHIHREARVDRHDPADFPVAQDGIGSRWHGAAKGLALAERQRVIHEASQRAQHVEVAVAPVTLWVVDVLR